MRLGTLICCITWRKRAYTYMNASYISPKIHHSIKCIKENVRPFSDFPYEIPYEWAELIKFAKAFTNHNLLFNSSSILSYSCVTIHAQF